MEKKKKVRILGVWFGFFLRLKGAGGGEEESSPHL